MKKSIIYILFAAFAILGTIPMQAQVSKRQRIDSLYRDYREVYRDTVLVAETSDVSIGNDGYDPYQVVSNPFRQNWFIFASGGAHTFRGDYSNLGPFLTTVSPEYSLGFGKWFMPWLGLKAEFIHSSTRGYTAQNGSTTPLFYPIRDAEGYPKYMDYNPAYAYYPMKTGWLDFSGSAMLNLTRLYYGYEGYGSRELMGQLLFNLGIGATHHLGYGQDHGSDNNLSAHFELQYSQFFTPKKTLSLDFKARALLYETEYDNEFGQGDYAARHIDSHLGLNIGLTWHLGTKGGNGWRSGTNTVYRSEYRETEVPIIKVKENDGPVKNGTITFYVFYPNNYSGRNDAPNLAGSSVNAIDYLAGGIFTQKVYADKDKAAAKLAAGQSPVALATKDLPTEPANIDFEIDFVPRGYEMLTDTPMSLSLKPSDMAAFGDAAGYYYAPINDGKHIWQYRIDDATLGQQLISDENYRETTSFGLNAHSGLNTVRQYMEVGDDDELVSFADVYAALTSNEGYVENFTDEATVNKIRDIINNGAILLIQADGFATSQDNYTGEDATRVGVERNSALAENRANTVINWLTADPRLQYVRSQSYIVTNGGDIRPVDDPSVRGLAAKTNRCVRVRIRYMIK